jgi:hypothetical protein
VAARDPRSYDLADFRTLGDRPYPPILLEAMERAGDRFVRWDEQVAHTGYCYRPVRLRGRVWQVDRRSRESAEEIGRLDASPHVRRLVAAAWTLGLVEHAHGLGFGGHFPTGVDSRMTIHGLRHSAVSIPSSSGCTRRRFRFGSATPPSGQPWTSTDTLYEGVDEAAAQALDALHRRALLDRNDARAP